MLNWNYKVQKNLKNRLITSSNMVMKLAPEIIYQVSKRRLISQV